MKLEEVRAEAVSGEINDVWIGGKPTDSYTVSLANHCYNHFDEVVRQLEIARNRYSGDPTPDDTDAVLAKAKEVE